MITPVFEFVGAWRTGIVIGYVPYESGTRVVVAPLGGNKLAEVPLVDLEFVISPERGEKKIRHAMKALRQPKGSSGHRA